MKKKNLKNVLAVLSAAALSARLALPVVFAESETGADLPVRTEFAGEREFKDDIIFIGETDGSEGETSVKCVAFGVPSGRGRGFGKFDGEPPQIPDMNGEDDVTPPERPDMNGEDDVTPPEKPSGDNETDMRGDGFRKGMKPGKINGGENAVGDETERPELPENGADFEKVKLEIAEGDTVSIAKADGTILYTVTADKDAKGVVFASDALETDETYTLLINGESAATAKYIERSEPDNAQNETGMRPGGPRFDGKRPPMNKNDSSQQTE